MTLATLTLNLVVLGMLYCRFIPLLALDIAKSDRYKMEMIFVTKAFRLESIEGWKISDLVARHPAMKEAINASHLKEKSQELIEGIRFVTVAFFLLSLECGAHAGPTVYQGEPIRIFQVQGPDMEGHCSINDSGGNFNKVLFLFLSMYT